MNVLCLFSESVLPAFFSFDTITDIKVLLMAWVKIKMQSMNFKKSVVIPHES